jgi:glycosyltransferase involved in cell wall biosynthesis
VRLAIVHPWLPQYRVPFFAQLGVALADIGVTCRIYYGQTPPEWTQRRDAGGLDGAYELPTRFIGLHGKNLISKDLSPVLSERPTHILVEQAIRNTESYRLLFQRRANGPRIGMWGHGGRYTEASSTLSRLLLSRLTRRADWFFAYTQGGATAVARMGFPASRTSVVNNAIDTRALRNELDLVTIGDLAAYRAAHSLSDGTALYIGGLDRAKRVDFLLRSIALVLRNRPSTSFLIVGDGAEADRVRAFATEWPQVTFLGRQFSHEKALALEASDVLLVPGRVGLVAVDSLTSGRPIITTDWPHHAPEFEYLEPGRTCLVTQDDEQAYANAILATLTDRQMLQRMQATCLGQADMFSIEKMVSNFVDGVARWRRSRGAGHHVG